MSGMVQVGAIHFWLLEARMRPPLQGRRGRARREEGKQALQRQQNIPLTTSMQYQTGPHNLRFKGNRENREKTRRNTPSQNVKHRDSEIFEQSSRRRATQTVLAQTLLQGPDVIHDGNGLLQSHCQLQHLEDCSAALLVLPQGGGRACEPEWTSKTPRASDEKQDHDRDAVSIRWDLLR